MRMGCSPSRSALAIGPRVSVCICFVGVCAGGLAPAPGQPPRREHKASVGRGERRNG